MQIGYFSTDWNSEPVVDEEKTQMVRATQYVPGQKRMSYGGTFYMRGALPAMELNQHGYDNHLAWQFRTTTDGHIETMDQQGKWQTPDVWYTQRWMHKDGAEQVRRARACGQVVVADLDDDFWALSKTNIAYHTTDPKNNPDFNREHYWKMLGACDAITVSTEALRKRVEPLGVPTFVVRNAINIEQWAQRDPGENGMVGWVGGIQWRSRDMQVMVPALRYFLEDNNLPFYHGGDSQADLDVRSQMRMQELCEQLGVKYKPKAIDKTTMIPKAWDLLQLNPDVTPIATRPLCHISTYPSLWEPMNVALVPLERVAFNQAKSYLKSLEACACGIPYICSKGMYEQRLLIDEGSAGREADNTKPMSWYDHLTDLLDPDVRRKEGAINRSIAEQHDIKIRWRDWDDAYKQVIGL